MFSYKSGYACSSRVAKEIRETIPKNLEKRLEKIKI